MGWSLANKTRPIKVEQIGTDKVRFTFNRPVAFKGFGFETKISMHNPSQGWVVTLVQTDVGPDWADYTNDHDTYDRWRITGAPDSLSTDPPGFKWPIGGSIPYSRAWPP